MRIALVVTGGFDQSGRRHVIPTLLALTERLSRHHQIYVYVLRYHPQPCTYPLLGATIRDLGRPSGVWRQYRQLVDALQQDGPFDVIHGYWGLPAGLVTVAAGRRLRVPTVVTCDSGEFVALPDIDYGSQLHRRQRLAIQTVTRLATRLTVCSQYQAHLAAAHHRSAAVIPLGVDTRLFTPSGRNEGPPWQLLHVASLNRVKDQATLLHAFERLVQRNLDVHLHIVGEDTLGGVVSSLAAQLGLSGRVQFPGFQPSDDLIAFYRRSHVFVLSSRHEAAGAVVLEAAACGVPVVGTAVGYIADWAPDRAVAVPTQDPIALADAVHGLLTDADRRQQIARNAQGWTSQHDADWTAREFERLYATLATPGS